MKKLLTICALTATTVLAAGAQPFDIDSLVWYDGSSPVTYQVDGKVDQVVLQALRMFSDDIEMVTGRRPQQVRRGRKAAEATIRIVQGSGADDGFRLTVDSGRQILVQGHNARGTAYGLLELSRMAGVSPWVWWGDVRPSRRQRLTIARDYCYEHTPSVAYRGVFINDEDWSLRQWSTTTFEPSQPMGPKTYKALFELLLRLRANTIWPAMHEGTQGFFTVRGADRRGRQVSLNKLMADSFAIVIGSSHCEPLLRNNVAEWDKASMGDYNYITNGERVRRYWADRLTEVRGSDALFTIGMRGIHDGSMEGVRTPDEKLHGLQQVIDDQRQLIRRYYDKNVEQVPQVFIPYKEVLQIMESGLRVPDDVTLMWCDDNYGYLTRLPDSLQQRRQGGGGVYYHLSYWGRPHDYLWLATTQPGLIYHEMRTAYDHNCRRLWIANIHDPKVAAYPLELFLDMAWDISLTPNPSLLGRGVAGEGHLQRWLTTQFGDVVGPALLPVMKEYYRLCAVRRPEFMGWTQVELDKKKFPGGKSVPSVTEFTLAEAYRRMADFARIEAVADVYASLVPQHLRDAYFAHVLYPLHAAGAMTRKMLSTDSVDSRRAYDDIQQLTRRYNALAGGRWQGLMSATPRQLPVFGLANTKPAMRTATPHPSSLMRQACQYDAADTVGGAPHGIPLLGHSMQAVALPRNSALTYYFDVPAGGDATLYTALIPTQPSDRGDLRYSVTLDDQPAVVISLKEPYRSERWKQNVLRQQALRQTPVRLSAGRHRLTLRALDDHIVLDQWMIDFQPQRQFYELFH
jgi:hypothetical protein